MKILLLILCIVILAWIFFQRDANEQVPPAKTNQIPVETQKLPTPEPKKIPDIIPKPKAIIVNPLQAPLPAIITEPKIVVLKSQRQLQLYSGVQLLRQYKIALGFNPKGNKYREGDGATPEGEFYIFTKNPKSAYYLSLGISYPNIPTAKKGLNTGLINKTEYARIITANHNRRTPPQNTKLGGLIYIHGRGNSRDWTRGCVALKDQHMRELFNVIAVGTPVLIKP